MLGKWANVDGQGAVVEFFDDGQPLMGDQNRSVAGNWTVIADGRIRMEMPCNVAVKRICHAAVTDSDSFQVEAAGVKGGTFRRQ